MSLTLLKGGHVIDPYQGLSALKDILIEGSKIVNVVDPGSEVRADTVLDVSGCIVSPGLVDIHVHLRDPGQEWKETVVTGSASAAAGGFTDICCMPNTLPVNDNASVTEFILKQSENGLCRVHPIGAITVESKGKELAPMIELTEAGCIAFSDDGWPVANSLMMRRALEYSKMIPRVLMLHEEDLLLSDDFAMNESPRSVHMGLRGMPDAAENVMIARDIELVRLTGGRAHFCHVSSARGVELIRRAKADGVNVTAEVTPQHLFMTEDAIADYDTMAKMSMPLRTQQDCDALLEGVLDGTIDCIATDHAPHELDSKHVEFERASFGMIGLQTSVPIMCELVHAGKLSKELMIDLMSKRAWACLGVEKQGLLAGEEASISVISMDRAFVFTKENNKSKSVNSPLLGQAFRGTAVLTMLDGKVTFNQLEESV